MTERVFARQIQGDLWQWRLLTNSGEWETDAWDTGDNEALKETMPASTPVCVILNGQTVVSTHTAMDEKDKRHLAKLLPFEMEEQLIDAIDDLHFSCGEIVNGHVPVLYGREELIKEQIDTLSELGCDVFHALPDYLMLSLPEGGGATLVLDANIVYVRLGPSIGFSVDAVIAEAVISRINTEYEIGAQIQLVAQDNEQLKQLHSWLPKAWLADEGPEILVAHGLYWNYIDTSMSSEFLNMRRGKFSRGLPVDKWIPLWRLPAIFIASAFALALAVHLSAYFSAKSVETGIRQEINAVYLDAVPNGRAGDPEGSLRSLARGADSGSTEPTNFMSLLSKVSSVVSAKEKTTLTTFSYNGQQRNLQLTLEVESIGELSVLREDLTKLGVKSDSPRTNRVGDKYQARMKVSEGT